jgi:hypothetical protein
VSSVLDDARAIREAIVGIGFDIYEPLTERPEVVYSRRARGAISSRAGRVDLTIEHWPYEPLAPRAWELRQNLSIYDATYVALAELTDATLITLDRRIAGAPGPRCAIATPEGMA